MSNISFTVLLIVATLFFWFLGYICGLKNKKGFYAGSFIVDLEDPLNESISVELECPLVEFLNQDEVYFKVRKKNHSHNSSYN